MLRLIRTTLAVAALAAVTGPALADGPAGTPRYTSPAAAEPAPTVAPAPAPDAVRAAPVQPTADAASAEPRTGQIALANGAKGADPFGWRSEFVQLARAAASAKAFPDPETPSRPEPQPQPRPRLLR